MEHIFSIFIPSWKEFAVWFAVNMSNIGKFVTHCYKKFYNSKAANKTWGDLHQQKHCIYFIHLLQLQQVK